MSAEALSRIQFGFTIGVHYLFAVTTLGLALVILILETGLFFRKTERFRPASAFLQKILGLVFVGGVATGILLPVEIGANWARFSRFAGPVLGPMVSLEAMIAFALESAFLAVLLWGRDDVPAWLRWVSAVCVFTGSHLSAVLIVAANSWMQTPAGASVADGHVVMTSLRDALFNPSMFLRVLHVLSAAWATGAFLVCGIAGWFAVRRRHADLTRTLLRLALPLALVTAVAQPVIGHFHIMNAVEHAPEKVAAFEGVFVTTKGAPLHLFGIPDAANRTIHLPVYLPCALSFLESGRLHSEVVGLDQFPADQWPPVNAAFTLFHLMVMLGVAMVAITGFGMLLLWRGSLEKARWYLLLLPWAAGLPYLANEIGWGAAEVGRQPWGIRGVLRTAVAHSANLPAWQVGVSLAGIAVFYVLLVALTLRVGARIVKQGPDAPSGEAQP